MADHYFGTSAPFPHPGFSHPLQWNHPLMDIHPPRFPPSNFNSLPPFDKQHPNWENLTPMRYPRFLSSGSMHYLNNKSANPSHEEQHLFEAIRRNQVMFGGGSQARKMTADYQVTRDHQERSKLIAGFSHKEASMGIDCSRPPPPPPLIRPPKGVELVANESERETVLKATIEHRPVDLFDDTYPLCLDLKQMQNCDVYPLDSANRSSFLSSSVDFMSHQNEDAILVDGLQFVRFYDHKLLALYCGSGEPYFCVNQLVDDVLEGAPNCLARMDRIAKQCNWVLPRPADSGHLQALKKCDIISGKDQHCGLIQRSLAEFLVQWCILSNNLEARAFSDSSASGKLSPDIDELITKTHASISISDQVYVYHECFGFSEGLFIPGTYEPSNQRQDKTPLIKCLNCKKVLKSQYFVCHSHNVPAHEHHWGFSSENWFLYIHVSEKQDKYEQKQKVWEEIVNEFVVDQSDCFSNCESSPNSCVEIISDDEIRSLNESQETQTTDMRSTLLLSKIQMNDETDFEVCDDLGKPTLYETNSSEEKEVELKNGACKLEGGQESPDLPNHDEGNDGEICVVDHSLSDICRCIRKDRSSNPNLSSSLPTNQMSMDPVLSSEIRENACNSRDESPHDSYESAKIISQFQPRVSTPLPTGDDIARCEGTIDYSIRAQMTQMMPRVQQILYNVPLRSSRPKSCFGFESNTSDEPGMDVDLVPRCLSVGVIDCYYQEDYSQELPLISSLMMGSNLQPGFLFPEDLLPPNKTPSVCEDINQAPQVSSSDARSSDSHLNPSKMIPPLSMSVKGEPHTPTTAEGSQESEVSPQNPNISRASSSSSSVAMEAEEWDEKSSSSASCLKPLNLSVREQQVNREGTTNCRPNSQSASPSLSDSAQRRRLNPKLKRPLTDSDTSMDNIPRKLPKRAECFSNMSVTNLDSTGHVLSQSELRKSKSRYMRHIHQTQDKSSINYHCSQRTFPGQNFDFSPSISTNHVRKDAHNNSHFWHPGYPRNHANSTGATKSGNFSQSTFAPPNLGLNSFATAGAARPLDSTGMLNPEQLLESSFSLLQTELSKLPLKEGLFLNRIYASVRAQVVQQLFQWRKLVAQKNEVIKKLVTEIDATRKQMDTGPLPTQMFAQSNDNSHSFNRTSAPLSSRVQSLSFAGANVGYHCEPSANNVFGQPIPASVGVRSGTGPPMINNRFAQYQQTTPLLTPPSNFPSRFVSMGSVEKTAKSASFPNVFPFMNASLAASAAEKTSPGFLLARTPSAAMDYDVSTTFLNTPKNHPKLPFTNLISD